MPSELVIRSNNVFDGEGREARPLAIGIAAGRIEAVVPADEVDSLVSPGTRVVDYGDAFVCPGFHDAHEHVYHAALFPSALADEYLGTSETDCVEHLIEFARAADARGDLDVGEGWLVSHGWRSDAWDPPVMPTRASLDAAFSARPVAMYSGDSHTLWLNSAGLARLGIDDDSQPIPGGVYHRDSDGHLTGVIGEASGMELVARVLATMPAGRLEGVYRDYFVRLNSLGITSVCDMALSLIPGADSINPEIYEALLADGRLTVRSHLFPTLADDESNLERLQERLTTDMLRAPGFKQFFDGVSSQHTAWESDPYANPRCPGDCGRPTIVPERMRELVLAAASRGHAVRIHTIGDQAVHVALDIFEEARRRYGAPTQGRNTLEHIEDIQPGDIGRFREADVIASVQPPHVVIDLAQPDRDLGPERAARMWPFDEFERAGATMAFGTDAPVVPPASQAVLWCAVTRRTSDTLEPLAGWHPEHDIPRASALRAYAHGSACAVGRESELGSLTPGMLADLVAWDTDLLRCPDEQILEARPLTTWVGGRCVWEA